MLDPDDHYHHHMQQQSISNWSWLPERSWSSCSTPGGWSSSLASSSPSASSSSSSRTPSLTTLISRRPIWSTTANNSSNNRKNNRIRRITTLQSLNFLPHLMIISTISLIFMPVLAAAFSERSAGSVRRSPSRCDALPVRPKSGICPPASTPATMSTFTVPNRVLMYFAAVILSLHSSGFSSSSWSALASSLTFTSSDVRATWIGWCLIASRSRSPPVFELCQQQI